MENLSVTKWRREQKTWKFREVIATGKEIKEKVETKRQEIRQ